MNTMTMIVGGVLAFLLVSLIFRLIYIITVNMINGRKFHQSLEQEFNRLRLNNMLSALGIDKNAYLYKTKVKDIHRQMKSCSDCENTGECDEKLSTPNVDISNIEFCNNEVELKEIKQSQSTSNNH